MGRVKGRFLKVSLPRRMVGDFLRAGRTLALTPFQRRMYLAEVLAARAAAHPRPSWCTIFTKALAAVTARRPQLRRTYFAWPWPRFFQYDDNLVSVVVEREWHGESALFLVGLRAPQTMSLIELEQCLRSHKERPVESISGFRRALRIARLPNAVRRFLWWLMMNWMPRTRGRVLGNLGVSVTAGRGAAALLVPAPWTITLFYDRFDEHGALDVRATFDHRVIDGAHISAALVDMEQELGGPILRELRGLRQAAAA